MNDFIFGVYLPIVGYFVEKNDNIKRRLIQFRTKYYQIRYNYTGKLPKDIPTQCCIKQNNE